jgi:hypothetical protein
VCAVCAIASAKTSGQLPDQTSPNQVGPPARNLNPLLMKHRLQHPNVPQVCWDWYHAAKESFADLADAIDQRLGQVGGLGGRQGGA